MPPASGRALVSACLWQIGRFPVADANDLYARLREIDWSAHMDADGTLAVDFSGSVPGITHTQFGAQRVKDAIVDQFREKTGSRPSVDRVAPTLRINVHAARSAVTVAIDLSGDSLHRRGYRGGRARRRSRRISRRQSCCVPAGLRSRRSAAASSIRCAARERFRSRRR